MPADEIKPNVTVDVPVQEWEEYQTKAKMLDALVAMGVDNWEGYGLAMKLFRGEDPDAAEED